MFLLIMIGTIAQCQSKMVAVEQMNNAQSALYSVAGVPDPSTTHEILFSIKQNNVEDLSNILNMVSDPSSKYYGKFLTQQEIASMTANPDGTAAVKSFLMSNGVTDITESMNGELITARAPVSIWESILSTKFSYYKPLSESSGSGSVIRTNQYFLPEDIAPNIVSVWDTVQLPIMIHH